MKPENTNQDVPVNQDEDVTFELEKEPAIPPTDINKLPKGVGETTLPDKEDTLGHSDFPPLTEAEKQPKLPNLES